MDAEVAVVGSFMIDLISYAPRLPSSGETLHGSRFAVGFGGKGANQCVAAAKLGAKSIIIGRLGNDSFGKDYLEQLKTLQIPVQHVSITEGSSGMAQIIVSESGENQIVIVAGANNSLEIGDVHAAAATINAAKVLVTQMEIPQKVTIEALKVKAESGTGFSIFNAAPAQSKLDPLLYSLPTIFCVNETEAELLLGEPLTSVSQAKEAAVSLQKKGCQHVIITLGANGAVHLAPASEPYHIPVTKQVQVVDTTGAGDAFIGALAFYLSREGELTPEVISKACSVATYSVQYPGTQTSFPLISQLPKDYL